MVTGSIAAGGGAGADHRLNEASVSSLISSVLVFTGTERSETNLPLPSPSSQTAGLVAEALRRQFAPAVRKPHKMYSGQMMFVQSPDGLVEVRRCRVAS